MYSVFFLPFNCGPVSGKHSKHQKEVFRTFVDFKKASDYVWHDGIRRLLKEPVIVSLSAAAKNECVVLNDTYTRARAAPHYDTAQLLSVGIYREK